MKLSSLFLVFLALYSCDGARILVIGPFGSASHKFFYMPIAEGLAEKGHHVTVVTSFPPKEKKENIREIVLGDAAGSPVNELNFFQMRKTLKLFGVIPTIPFRFWFLGGVIQKIYENLVSNQEFQQLQREEKFDIVLVDAVLNDFCLPVVDQWKVPIIQLSPAIGPPWVLKNMGVPYHLASYPFSWNIQTDQMTFYQRLLNTLEVLLVTAARETLLLNPLNSRIQKDYPGARTIQEIEKEISLCIVNSHPALNFVRPLPPTVIEVSGMQIKPKPKPLPTELAKFADESGEHGFILFTLGSAIKSTSIPVEIVQSFVEVFSQIPQRVIWKWEADEKPANLPPNVMTVKWAPQSDLLAHPNVRLFITHGGLQGTQEAMFNSVPMLGLPVVNDQMINMVKLSKEGCALTLLWEDINTDNFKDAVTSIVGDPKYQENMSRLSKLLRDEPIPSKEKAVYWVEYVLRHGGAKHLRMSSLDLPIYQNYLLDVILLMVVIVLLAICSFVLTVRWLCTRNRRVNDSRKVKSQ